jgi:flagellar basal body-associated protein FliL
MKSKLKIIIPLLVVVLGGAYKFVLAKPAPAAPKPKVHGEVYVLPKDFYINLEGGRFARLGVALVIEEGTAVAAGGHGEGAATEPPEGYGTLPQEALVRSIVTDVLTDASAEELQRSKTRDELTEKILKRIEKTTDVHAEHVLLTDVAVQ